MGCCNRRTVVQWGTMQLDNMMMCLTGQWAQWEGERAAAAAEEANDQSVGGKLENYFCQIQSCGYMTQHACLHAIPWDLTRLHVIPWDLMKTLAIS